MIIYSETALSFLKAIKVSSLKILKYEMGLPFERKRLLYNGYYYPLDFVIFEHPNILGQYVPGKYQIQINKRLIYKVDVNTLENIIRHELCHFIAHVEFGDHIDAHGKEFLQTCARFGYGKDISRSTLEIGENIDQLKADKVFKKITKLFKLAASDNNFEAELATTKANQLLREHHLHKNQVNPLEDETVLKIVLRGKKVSAKHEAIYLILKEFLVAPVFSYQRGGFTLEVIGHRTNVLTASYIASFLNHSLEKMYEDSKKCNPTLRGVRAKKSFMNGVANGYLSKIISSTNLQFTKNELIKCEAQVQEHLQRAYPRLRAKFTRAGEVDSKAQSLGHFAGKNLHINPAICNSTIKPLLLD